MGIFGAEACGNTSGTVLVDEIDLHLHPTLQSVVVNSLKKAFPNLQFIITSHAPMIMTGIELAEGNKIYQLRFQESEGYMAREVEMYGMDASTIIEDIIGIPARTKEVDENLKTLFSYIDADQYRKAKEVLQQMRDRFGEKLPELSRAEAMLNFLKEE
jgi:predicted ATP-binding protein involved in virulence